MPLSKALMHLRWFAFLALLASTLNAGGPGFTGPQDATVKKIARRSVIITTDCGAEMDDQWTLAQTALAPEVELLAVVTTHAPSLAAPAAESSARVAREVLAHLPLRTAPSVFAGSSVPLRDRATPQRNDGVDFLLERSRAFSATNRLAVFLLGAATDVASALLLDPTLADRVELIAMAFDQWPEGGDSWNAKNDIAAWQVVLESRAPLVIGDATVTKRDLAVTRAQVAARTGAPGSATRYLADLHTAWLDRDPPFIERVTGDRDMWPVWDSVTLAWLLGWAESQDVPRPTLRDDLRFETAVTERPEVKWITRIAADALWGHFARHLAAADAARAPMPVPNQ